MKTLLLSTACLLLLLAVASCSKSKNDETYLVEYNIGCTDCQVSYTSDAEGNQITENNQNSNWTYSFYGKKDQIILLLAYNTSDVPQGVNVKVSVNNEVYTDRTTYCAISGVAFAADTIGQNY